MKRFFQNLKYNMQQWSYGRYGYDELSRFLYYLSIVFIVLSFIPNCQFFLIVGFVILLVVSFRTSSRNTAKRKLENDKYLNHTQGIRSWLAYKRQVRTDRKVYCYFTCKKCGRHYRVPKGKGKIKISCPGCGNTVIKKT